MTSTPTFPKEIFPEDKLDPTAGTKEQEYHVERTIGVIGHVKGVAKKRHWRYLVQEGVPAREAFLKIREFYGLPESAFVASRGDTWAVWSGDGEPTSAAFEPLPEAGTELEPVLAEVLKNAPAGTTLVAQIEMLKNTAEKGVQHGWSTNTEPPYDSTKTVAMLEAGEREAAHREAHAKKIDETLRETWAYSSKDITDHAAMRLRYEARPDAPIETHPSGDIAAIWLGKGTPSRPAFPEVAVQPKSAAASPATNGVTQLTGEPNTRVPEPVEVSPHVPSAALNDMGLKIYRLSKNDLFSKDFRDYLLRVSDSFHAEAARIELAKVRANFDSRNR